MKIDIDLNKITDLSKDVKNTLLQNKREIASLNKKVHVRDEKIATLKRELLNKDHQMNELLRLKNVLGEFFRLGTFSEDLNPF